MTTQRVHISSAKLKYTTTRHSFRERYQIFTHPPSPILSALIILSFFQHKENLLHTMSKETLLMDTLRLDWNICDWLLHRCRGSIHFGSRAVQVRFMVVV